MEEKNNINYDLNSIYLRNEELFEYDLLDIGAKNDKLKIKNLSLENVFKEKFNYELKKSGFTKTSMKIIDLPKVKIFDKCDIEKINEFWKKARTKSLDLTSFEINKKLYGDSPCDEVYYNRGENMIFLTIDYYIKNIFSIIGSIEFCYQNKVLYKYCEKSCNYNEESLKDSIEKIIENNDFLEVLFYIKSNKNIDILQINDFNLININDNDYLEKFMNSLIQNIFEKLVVQDIYNYNRIYIEIYSHKFNWTWKKE